MGNNGKQLINHFPFSKMCKNMNACTWFQWFDESIILPIFSLILFFRRRGFQHVKFLPIMDRPVTATSIIPVARYYEFFENSILQQFNA